MRNELLFLVIVCYMLQQLVFVTSTEISWHNFVHCQLCNA